MSIYDEVRFDFNNLGVVKKAENISLKPLTLFCGPNNSGKTWVLYSLCHFFELAKGHSELKKERGDKEKQADKLGLERPADRQKGGVFVEALSDFFNVPEEIFEGTVFNAHFTGGNNALDYILADKKIPDTFLIPAERNGLHLFFRELNNRRTRLLHHASKKNIDLLGLLKAVVQSPYAAPIANYIDWLNDITSDYKTTLKKSPMQDYAYQDLQRDILGGAYSLDKNGNIGFKPYQIRGASKAQRLSLHSTSSTVRSFFGLWFYLTYQAKKGDILMIDEPELHIHPANQRKVARLLAKLVNKGLRVVVSTHSDYLVKEINTLIMLSQEPADKDGKFKLREKYNYTDDEVLKPEKVGAYLFDKQTIKPFAITAADGIEATTFDEVINGINTVSNDIYYSLQTDEQDGN